jgi:hypothetical protein
MAVGLQWVAVSSDPILDQLPLGDRLRRRLRRHVALPLERKVVARVRRRLNAGRAFQPVFVAGAMGSGTTLLAFSLAQRFECACVIEEGAIQIDAKSFLHASEPDAFESVRAYQEHMTPKAGWSLEQGREDMQALYRAYAWGTAEVVFDKGPNAHLLRTAFLARCFPEARFVMVFRDPVANVEGFRRKWARFRCEPLQESIRFYREIHERFLSDASALGDRVAIVRYETLLEAYEETLEALRQRLGLEPARQRRRLPTRANVEGVGIRNVQGGSIGIVHSANQRAHGRLDAETRETLDRTLGPLHERMRGLALLS